MKCAYLVFGKTYINPNLNLFDNLLVHQVINYTMQFYVLRFVSKISCNCKITWVLFKCLDIH
jgi:hypothetical protein